jgi:ornithine carbamoyltransferase
MSLSLPFPMHFLSVRDLSREQFCALLELSTDLKRRPSSYSTRLEGRSLGLVFQKPSTRTRVSFDVGMNQLGGHTLSLLRSDLHLGRGETIGDTVRVMSRYLDVIATRLYSHTDLEEMATCSSIPVINALTDDLHPCQMLADFFTLQEEFGDLESLKLAYVGDGNNVARSLLLAATLLGVSISIASPSGYQISSDYETEARALAQMSGAEILFTDDPSEAVAESDAVYTDVWASMGQEDSAARRKEDFRGYCVDADLMTRAKPSAIFLHCLPAHRGEEVSAEVADGSQSRIFDQAENRLHSQKALLLLLLGKGEIAG